MKKYRSYKGEQGKAADNELNRQFRAEKPNQKWVTDVTEFRLFGQKLYLSPILDLYSGDIVTYTISDSPNLLMVTTMLEQAFRQIPDNTGLAGVNLSRLNTFLDNIHNNNLTPYQEDPIVEIIEGN